MYSFYFLSRRSFTSIAGMLALIAISPQTLLAQTANTAYGFNALAPNTGSHNSAFGNYSLFFNTTGTLNTAVGSQALFGNSTGYNNVAVGVNALYANTSGSSNTASGMGALYSNTTGFANVAVGVTALYSNTGGFDNVGLGANALRFNTTGATNVAIGPAPLYYNTTGYSNAAVGGRALYSNTTGYQNTAMGFGALYNNINGTSNIGIGYYSGSNITGNNNIDIGNEGSSTDNGITRIGTTGTQTQTFIAGISGVRTMGGVQVYINSAGQLGTLTSSERFKKDIKSIDSVSDKLLQLRPVSFLYKEDEKNEVQYGLIAEEVAEVYPELVQYDAEGKPFTVYYHLLTPLLLSELQKEHVVSKTQQEKIDYQQTELAYLNQQLVAQRAEMLAMQQQQKQQLNEMTVLQQKLNQLDNLLQANAPKGLPSARAALIATH